MSYVVYEPIDKIGTIVETPIKGRGPDVTISPIRRVHDWRAAKHMAGKGFRQTGLEATMRLTWRAEGVSPPSRGMPRKPPNLTRLGGLTPSARQRSGLRDFEAKPSGVDRSRRGLPQGLLVVMRFQVADQASEI